MLTDATPEGDQVVALRAFVQRELEAHGAIHVTKDGGVFIAARPAT